jgi:hypothetical protein
MRLLLMLLLTLLMACASTPYGPGTLCMDDALGEIRLELAGHSDDYKHCLATATLVRRCGRATGFVAGYGKELVDLFGPGRAQRGDLRANAVGRACASEADEAGVRNCCSAARYQSGVGSG